MAFKFALLPSPSNLFIISGANHWREMGVISAFPAFSSGLSAKLINDSLKHFCAIPQNITFLGLYVQTMDELGGENVLSAVRSISDYCVDIFSFDLYVGDCMIHLVRPPTILSLCPLATSIDDLTQKNPEALASVLSSFTGRLRELGIEFWERPWKDNQPAYFFQDQKLKLCNVWSEECPSLAYISFPDHSQATRQIGLGWNIEE